MTQKPQVPQKEIETWPPSEQAAYWRGFKDGCKMTFDFTGPHDGPGTEFVKGPQHDARGH